MSKLNHYLNELEEAIEEAKPVMLKPGIVNIEKDYFLEVIDDIRDNCPSEIEKAQQIIKEHDIILKEAEQKANKIIEEAKIKANQLVNEHDIYVSALEASKKLEAEARENAEDSLFKAVEYIDEILERANETVAKSAEFIDKELSTINENYKRMSKEIYEARLKLRDEE